MNNCDFLITKDLKGDCTKPLVRGYSREGVLLNFEDVVSYTTAVGALERGEFSGIVRKQGTKGYSIISDDTMPFSGTVKAGVSKAIGVQSQKTVKFMFTDSGLTADNAIDIVQNGYFIVVLKKVGAGSNSKSKYEIIGKEAPLIWSATAQDINSTDNDGAWDVTLQTTELHTGNYLWDTDAETTEALFQGLKTLAV